MIDIQNKSNLKTIRSIYNKLNGKKHKKQLISKINVTFSSFYHECVKQSNMETLFKVDIRFVYTLSLTFIALGLIYHTILFLLRSNISLHDHLSSKFSRHLHSFTLILQRPATSNLQLPPLLPYYSPSRKTIYKSPPPYVYNSPPPPPYDTTPLLLKLLINLHQHHLSTRRCTTDS